LEKSEFKKEIKNFFSKKKYFTALWIMEILNEKVKKIDEKKCLNPAFFDQKN